MNPKHIQEWKNYHLLRDKMILFDAERFNPLTFPEHPYDFVHLLETEQVVEQLTPALYGQEVAIIGAGCGGLCAAYELMKAGLRPVIYEASNRIGGRTYSYRFPKDERAYAEVGAMRIPVCHPLVNWYMDKFGIERIPFPTPLRVPTVIFFDQERYEVPAGGNLPEKIQKVADEWTKLIQPLVDYLQEAKEDLAEFSARWQNLVEQYHHKSIFQVLHEAGWSKELINQFGSIGDGGAPFGPFYHQVSFTEPLRVIASGWWGEVKAVKGGIETIPLKFWETETDCLHWGRTSVKALNYGMPRKAVKEIETTDEGIYITDAEGNLDKYPCVIITCTPRTLEMGVKVNRQTFSTEVWNAIRNMYLIPGGRLCVRTKTAFWKENPELLSVTVTDEPLTHLFPFDFPDTPSGVICLSYTLGTTAIKFDAFNAKEQIEICLRQLERIYGEKTVKTIREQMVEEIYVSWEEEYGYNGSFKMPVPGYAYDEVMMFRQGKFQYEGKQITKGHYQDNGIYFSGDSVAWSGGWIEGALQAAITSAIAVVQKMNKLI